MKAVTLTARTKDMGMYQMHFMLCPVMYQKYILYQKSVRSEKTGHRLEGLIPAGKQMILSADGKVQPDYAQLFITKCCHWYILYLRHQLFLSYYSTILSHPGCRWSEEPRPPARLSQFIKYS